ncbi:MAG: hypothetical protein K1X86_15515 [Ignavibacteria bacterium]|nr:hypothetical protein [Ignavibacteria bacterium]
MKSKIPKFLYSRSVIGGREFIIHTQYPRMICEAIHNADKSINIQSRMLLDIDLRDGWNEMRFAKLMSRMGDWYQYAILQKKGDIKNE